ncbi:MAG: hypothetical protein L6R39_000259 [Caloplaca ligustica]|nr:MAG: hypothetical protein L6R39_000259 [Caloplaca ligustica]
MERVNLVMKHKLEIAVCASWTITHCTFPLTLYQKTIQAEIYQVEDTLTIKLPTAILRILLPKVESVEGTITTTRVYPDERSRYVDLVAQQGNFKVWDQYSNELFEYQETSAVIASRLLQASEIRQTGGNAPVPGDAFSSNAEVNKVAAASVWGRPDTSRAESLENHEHAEGLSAVQAEPERPLFICPDQAGKKRRLDAESTLDDISATPPGRNPIPVVPFRNSTQKVMPARERYDESQDRTTPPRIQRSVSRTCPGREGSASRTRQELLITPLQKNARTRNTNESLSQVSQRFDAPLPGTSYGASPSTGNSRSDGIASDSAGGYQYVPKINSCFRNKGTQPLVTKHRGMANYKPKPSKHEQTSPDDMKADDDIPSIPPRHEPSPTARKSASRVDRETLRPRPNDIRARKLEEGGWKKGGYSPNNAKTEVKAKAQRVTTPGHHAQRATPASNDSSSQPTSQPARRRIQGLPSRGRRSEASAPGSSVTPASYAMSASPSMISSRHVQGPGSKHPMHPKRCKTRHDRHDDTGASRSVRGRPTNLKTYEVVPIDEDAEDDGCFEYKRRCRPVYKKTKGDGRSPAATPLPSGNDRCRPIESTV